MRNRLGPLVLGRLVGIGRRVGLDSLVGMSVDQPGDWRRLRRIRERIDTPVAELRAEVLRSPEPIPFEDLDPSAFAPIEPGEAWGRTLDCAWLRITGDVPDGVADPLIQVGIRGEGLVLDARGDVLDGISTVWQQGDLPHAGGRYRTVRNAERAIENGRLELFVDATWNVVLLWPVGRGRFDGARVAVRDPEAHGLYYDYLTLAVLAEHTEDDVLRVELRRSLDRAWVLFLGGALDRARAALAPALAEPSDIPLTYSAIGHGHLDTAWLWPIRETQRKHARTVARALANIDERPGFVMGLSQPQQLAWLQQQHPLLFARVKDAVAAGRIELQGSFWVECDTNMPSGESLIRQAVVGRRFLRREFGLADDDLRLCWLPDTFGYSGNLPQLLRGAGMDWFQTIKLSWNRVTLFPHRTFRWEGIDGSDVLVHMPPEGDYNSRAAPDGLLSGLLQYPERALGTALLVYGSGDGGGGPDERHLELTARERDLRGLPRVEPSSASDFFRELEMLPIEARHRGELYLETHQGTYTTQAAIKRGNRTVERMLHDAETLAAIIGRPARDDLEQHWRDLLTHQFHDILPGSSIARVNREAAETYARLESSLTDYARARIAELDRAEGEAPTVLNLSPVRRDEHLRVDGRWYRADVGPYAAAELLPAGPGSALRADARILSNDAVELRFDESGALVSLRDADGGEHAAGAMNRLAVYPDPYRFPFDAWDIDPRYSSRRPRVLVPDEVESGIDGPTAWRRSVYRLGRSRLVQRIVLESGDPLVRFETEVEWHESHRMLRAEFRPAHYGPIARCEIQFGHLERSTAEATDAERAQFEVCAHRWVTTEDAGGGFALLNDGKYGHRTKSGLLSLALLRSPTFPDRGADRGSHHFSYAVRPFGPGALDEVIRDGYRLNAPLQPIRGVVFDPVAEADARGVIIETLKPAEDGRGTVVRMYESLGRATTAALRIRLDHGAAIETDLLERPIGPIDLDRIAFSPFQIRTILLPTPE